MVFECCIPAGHPALSGHFPGRPIVPAALLLNEISRGIERLIGEQFCCVKKVRFSAPIKPDQLITVDYREVNLGEYRFECRVVERVVAKGLLSTAGGNIDLLSLPRLDRYSRVDTAAIYQKLPHHGSICLLESIDQVGQEHIRCTVNPISDNPLAQDGELPTWASLEYAAQAFASHGLLNSQVAESGGELREVWVVGIKSLYCSDRNFPLSKSSPVITARLIANQPSAASYQFSLNCGTEHLSSGQVNVAFGPG